MPIEIIVPEIGEPGMDLTFVSWMKQEGDEVKEGEELFEIDTMKTTVIVESLATGVLRDVRVQPGDVVQHHQVLAVIVADGEGPTTKPTHRLASPRARGLARDRQVDVESIVGSGPDGLVTEADVLAVSPRPTEASSEPAAAITGTPDADSRERKDRVRGATAALTSRSWSEIPHFHLEYEADVSAALEFLPPTALLVAALARVLRDEPDFNVEWRDAEAVPRKSVDLGILIDTPHGLLLPRIPDADRLRGADLDDAIHATAERARRGIVQPVDLGTRSGTISNLGMYPVDRFLGIIPAPDTLLLTAGRARTAPVWDGGAFAARKVMRLTLSMDHRVFDGADGARLLQHIDRLLAIPATLMDDTP